MTYRQRIKTRNPGEELPDGVIVPEYLQITIGRIDDKEPERITINAFGQQFKDIVP